MRKLEKVLYVGIVYTYVLLLFIANVFHKYQKVLHETNTFNTSSVDMCKLVHEVRVFEHYAFYPRDAMLARVFAIATCPSVRPPHAGIVPSRAKAGS